MPRSRQLFSGSDNKNKNRHGKVPTTTTTTTQKCIERNDKAVAMIRRNKNCTAACCIMKSLEKNRRSLSASSSSTKEDRSVSRRIDIMDVILYSVPVPFLTTSERAFSPNSSFDVFNKAFRLMVRDGIDPICNKLVQAVLFYNMGLAFHREGIQKCDSDLLKQAMQVYEISYAHLLQSQYYQADVDHILSVFALAIINNIGQLHSTFLDFDGEQMWRRALSEVLWNVDNKLNAANMRNDEDMIFFSIHLLCSTGYESALAPAA